MRLISARQAWHDAYVNNKKNTIEETLMLGTFIQKTAIDSSLNHCVHSLLAGEVQNAIESLPFAYKCFGNFMYKANDQVTTDELETAQEAVKLHFLYKNVNTKFTDDKLNKIHYLIYAALLDYRKSANGGGNFFNKNTELCHWLYDLFNIKIDVKHWRRDFEAVYDDILNSCNSIDKQALAPVAEVIKKYKKRAA